ncbi:MAG: hypothetical protein MZW92_52200 [Comamonadaceae bacterium]|nr:hypothetical protein [Comamonadaceae bacterium]
MRAVPFGARAAFIMTRHERRTPTANRRQDASRRAAVGTHGGAWKIAYADFVTAMMAFFLLMWLHRIHGQGRPGRNRAITSRHPLKVALQGGSGSGDASSLIKGGGQDLREVRVRSSAAISRHRRSPSTSRPLSGEREQHEVQHGFPS